VISSNLKVKTSLCNSVHTEPGKAGKPEKYAIFTKSGKTWNSQGIFYDFIQVREELRKTKQIV